MSYILFVLSIETVTFANNASSKRSETSSNELILFPLIASILSYFKIPAFSAGLFFSIFPITGLV